MATGWPMKTTYANGDVYSASDVNDITGTVNLASGAQWAAGKNKIINGDFAINQRSFTTTSTIGAYGFDRFFLNYSQVSGTNPIYSAQTFTAGTAPVAGYESKNFARLVTANQANAADFATLEQRIEDVRTFAGQTVTVSFWAKAASGTPKVGIAAQQSFGSGGSAAVSGLNTTTTTISSSWARYSVTFAVPSISGKTIGAGSYLELFFMTSVGSGVSIYGYPAVGLQNITVDFWGIQIEAASSATAFQTATGTLQGELAACQRYYALIAAGNELCISMGANYTATQADGFLAFPVTMRTTPTLVATSGTGYYAFIRNGGSDAFNSLTLYAASLNGTQIYNATEISGTAGQAGTFRTQNALASIAVSAEL